MRFNKTLFIPIFITTFILAVNASADNFSSGPLCYKTSKPLLFSPEYLKQRYNEETKKYKICVENYIAEQMRAIQLHKDSITEAEKLLEE